MASLSTAPQAEPQAPVDQTQLFHLIQTLITPSESSSSLHLLLPHLGDQVGVGSGYAGALWSKFPIFNHVVYPLYKLKCILTVKMSVSLVLV